jgi:hypothetical protein
MREAGSDAKSDEIGSDRRDNRNGRCRALGGKNSRSVGHDDIDLESNQLGRQSQESVLMSICKAKFDVEVPALDVAEVTKAIRKCVDGSDKLEADVGPRYPIRASRSACCARAASGHAAAAPPSAATNSRRAMVAVIYTPARGCLRARIQWRERAVFTSGRGDKLPLPSP